MSLPVWPHVLSGGWGDGWYLVPGGGMALPSVNSQTHVKTLPSHNFEGSIINRSQWHSFIFQTNPLILAGIVKCFSISRINFLKFCNDDIWNLN